MWPRLLRIHLFMQVTYEHRIYVAKRTYELGFGGYDNWLVQWWHRECLLVSTLYHPNIVLFIGLSFLPGSQLPAIVMEKLDTSLDNFLKQKLNIALTLKRSILNDIASGLLYLHKRQPPIIHWDLTARNVLLTSSFVAKISDMSLACLTKEDMQNMSQPPFAVVYMPPEVFMEPFHYGLPGDVFSCGCIVLFALIQVR